MTNKKFALLFLRLLTFACGPFRTWDSELTPGGPLNPGTSGCWSSPLSADDRSIPNPEFHHHRPLPPLRPPSRQWRPARPRAERATSYGGVVSSNGVPGAAVQVGAVALRPRAAPPVGPLFFVQVRRSPRPLRRHLHRRRRRRPRERLLRGDA
jgi:hypothetical protein